MNLNKFEGCKTFLEVSCGLSNKTLRKAKQMHSTLQFYFQKPEKNSIILLLLHNYVSTSVPSYPSETTFVSGCIVTEYRKLFSGCGSVYE